MRYLSYFNPLAMAALAAFSCAGVLNAQANPVAEQLQSLNSEVLRIYAQLGQADPASAALHRGQAAPLLERRQAALAALIQQDAGQALALAFSPGLVAQFGAAFAQSASRLESYGNWQGPIEYLILDDPTLTMHRSIRRMRVAGETLDIHFAGAEPKGLKNGDLLLVRGMRAGNNVAAADSSIQGSEVTSGACSTTGIQKSAILLLTFPGVTPPSVTPQGVYDVFFSPSGRSVDGFWQEASYGKTSAAGDVFGWFTLDASYTCDQSYEIRDAAIRAADAFVDFSNYSHIFLVFPSAGSCSYAGLATLGCGSLSSPGDGSFTASTAWLIANYMTSRDQGVKLSAHEAGHNLTLHHASSRDYGTEALGPFGVPGSLSEYGDVFSTMGSWNLGQYAAPHKQQLNWLVPGVNVQKVESGGVFSLQPLETNPAGVQALKVRRGTGNDAWLWVEYRQPLGQYDSTLPSQAFSGALIHYEDSITGTHSHLLDFTPETSSWSDPALSASKSWVDPYSNVSLSVQSVTANALTVEVSYGSAPCGQANPTVILSPAHPSASVGDTVAYTASVTNNDTTGCPGRTFTLSSSLPSNWAGSFSSASLTLGPGQAGSAAMTKTVPPGTPPGAYSVNVTASAGGNSGTGAATCTVVAPPQPLSVALSISAAAASFSKRLPVPLTASVMNGSTPAPGASVTFTVTEAGGNTTTKTVTANSSGIASWTFRIGPKDPPGTYSASARAAYGSQSATSNLVTFTVQ
jgi:M6 family metalloprotease-like protein